MTAGAVLVRRVPIAGVAGAAWVLALPPIGWWVLAPVGLALLLLALEGIGPGSRAAVGATTGVIVFGVTLRWAVVLTGPGFVLLVLSQAAFVAAAAALTPRGRGSTIAFPGALVLTEWLRHRWPLSGLPLSGVDLTQAGGPLLPLVSLGGPLLLVLTAAVLGSLGAAGVRRRRPAPLAGAVALVALSSMAAPALHQSWTHAAGDPLSVAVVQGGGPRGIPAVRSDPDVVLARHLAVSATVEGPVDLLLWPEDVVDTSAAFASTDARRALSGLARRLGAVVVVGVVVDAHPGASTDAVRRFRNLAVTIEPDGSLGPAYDKVIRVPFGEYVPWRRVLDRIIDLSLVPRDAVPGDGPGVLDTSVGDLGVSISFEGLFASRSRAAVATGAELLLNPTNAASYVTSDVPSQQVAAARLRAVETGRTVLVAGPTGPSAIVDAMGAVVVRSALERPAVLRTSVSRRTGLTPYVRYGDAPVLATGLLLLALGWSLTTGAGRPQSRSRGARTTP